MRILIGLILLALPLIACGGTQENADPSDSGQAPSEPVQALEPENVQIVRVRVEGDAYIFFPASVRAGTRVRLVFDPAGLPGCSRDVAVPAFQVTKVISAEDATIEFTPEEEGPIAVACSMDMYRGTLMVE